MLAIATLRFYASLSFCGGVEGSFFIFPGVVYFAISLQHTGFCFLFEVVQDFHSKAVASKTNIPDDKCQPSHLRAVQLHYSFSMCFKQKCFISSCGMWSYHNDRYCVLEKSRSSIISIRCRRDEHSLHPLDLFQNKTFI